MNQQHTCEVQSLWEAYNRCENNRVPIVFACDEQTWLKVSGHTFGEFYTRPEAHLKAQLLGKEWFCKNIVGDTTSGLPERWHVVVQLWMEENEFFGCETVYQENDYAWGMPLSLNREDLLHYLADLDPEDRVRQSRAFKMYQALKELAEGMAFLERPVSVLPPGGGTMGIFTKAAEIRGLERICLDLYEAPDFAEMFLHLVTEKTLSRIKAWHRLTCGEEMQLPSEGGFSFPDDSLQLIGKETYEEFVLPCHERLFSAMTRGQRGMHLCGHASHHYHTLRYKLHVTAIDGPGPFVDHGYYLKALGPDFSFAAQMDHTVLAQGSEARIEDMMRKLLSPSAKAPGRFHILGYITRDTPLRNVEISYRAGRNYGMIEC